MSATSEDITQYVSCFYDTLPVSLRRRAYVSARPDVVQRASQLLAFTAPRGSYMQSQSYPKLPWQAPYPYVRWHSIYTALRETHTTDRVRVFANLANMYVPTLGQGLGKLAEVFFYVRYRRHRQQGMNEVFTVRVIMPVPLDASCSDSVAARWNRDNVELQHSAAVFLTWLMGYALSDYMVNTVYIPEKVKCTAKGCGGRFPNLAVMRLLEVIPMDLLQAGAATLFRSNLAPWPADVDRDRLRDVGSYAEQATLKANLAEGFVSAIEDMLGYAEIIAACRELPPGVLSIMKPYRPALVKAAEEAFLANDCSLGWEEVRDLYLYPRPEPLSGPVLDFGGSVSGYGTLKMALYLWAQGSLKWPLLGPSVLILERGRFTDAMLEAFTASFVSEHWPELSSAGTAETARYLARAVYSQAVSAPWEVPERFFDVAYEAMPLLMSWYELGPALFPGYYSRLRGLGVVVK